MSLQTIVFIADNIMVNSEELIGATEYLLLSTRCCINCCHNNWVQLVCGCVFVCVSGCVCVLVCVCVCGRCMF